MELLLLCEGNAETRDCWSGSAKSLLDGLRDIGHSVQTIDTELYGVDRWVGAGLAFSPNRTRWGVKYRLSAAPFHLRSRRARSALEPLGEGVHAIIQIGATFEVGAHSTTPFYLYCDSNICMAERGAASGYSNATSLTSRELDAIRTREARIYRRAAGIFAISDHLRDSFISDFGLDESRVRSVHAGPNFDVSSIRAHTTNPRSPDRPPTILFVGRQFKRKGGDILLDAFQLVRERIPDARLIIIGPEGGTADVGVEYRGFLDKDNPAHREALLEAYTTADVFCLPTRFEPFGIAFLEAMYFGLPCVGTRAWAVPEMITEGVTGYTVPVDDRHALADRLTMLLKDRGLAKLLGEAGLARAQSHFTWRAVATRMCDAIRESALTKRSVQIA